MKDKDLNPIREVSLDDLINGITNHDKLTLAQARMKALEEAGNRLAFLMLNGSTEEMRQSVTAWRKLVPTKKGDDNE